MSETGTGEDSEEASIEQLIQKARQGESGALDLLFTRSRSYLGIAAAAQMETWANAKYDASDIVQQTMLEAYRGFDKFQGNTTGEWLAWLKQILTRNSADLVRQYRQAEKRQVRREVPLLGDDSHAPLREPAASAPSPSAQFHNKELELKISDALASLDEDYRQVIVLRNLQRLSFEEVAAEMQRSRPAVQMLWMRAIKKLQTMLNTDAHESG